MVLEWRRVLGGLVPSMFVCLWTTQASGDGLSVGVVSAHAKGLAVLPVSFPNQGEVDMVHGVSLDWSVDGETFYDAAIGLPRSWQLFKLVRTDAESTTILVPAVGGFAVSDPRFLFDEPGTYYVRWEIGFKDSIAGVLHIDQTVNVEKARASDLEFITRLGDADFLRYLFGKDFFERQTDAVRERMLSREGADYRALKVIAKLLQATRSREPWGAVPRPKSLDTALKWGDALWPLAREFPDSSYAPYAAYQGGCCYLAILLEETEDMMEERGIKERRWSKQDAEAVVKFVKSRRSYTKADDALGFAVAHGDAYLKPRALYMQAFLATATADWDDIEGALDQALEAAPGRGTIYNMVSKLREDLAYAREKMEAKATTEQR